jgi:hypothetical protein
VFNVFYPEVLSNWLSLLATNPHKNCEKLSKNRMVKANACEILNP